MDQQQPIQQTPAATPQPSASPSPQPPAAPAKGTSGLGIAGLVLGIISLCISFVPIVNNFAALLAFIGLILAIIGTVLVVKKGTGGKGIAIAAIVLNAVAIVVVLATQSLYSAALDEALSTTSSSSTTSTSIQASEDAASTATQADSSAKYNVSIDGCERTTDYAGVPAIVVTYTWTNNSDTETSFMVAINDEAYQNGVELDTAIVTGIDSSAMMNNLKPGATTTVQQAFVLDDNSDVTIECSELISLSKTIIAEKTFSVA